MIQLYRSDNTDYENNGDITLGPSSATVHTVLNGTWEAELDHPIDQKGKWKEIVEEAVIKMPSFNGNQLFRIKRIEKSDSGVIATLEPIFMDAMNDCFLVDVRPTIKNGQEALDMMMAPNEKYSGESNIVTTATAYYQFKNLIEAINGDDENAFTKRWGGEILYDNFHIHVDDHIGSDHGVELRYGKNIPQNGMSEDVDISSVITRIYPKAYNGYTMTDNGYVDSPIADNYPIIKAATMTFSDVKMREDEQEDDEENGVIICDTQAELDTALIQRCNEQYSAGLDKPKVTISADMVLLKDTIQYKDYEVLENVSLGDTIHCINNHLGIVTDARVIELEYDCLRKTVSSVVIGDFQYDYFGEITSNVTQTGNRVSEAIRDDGSIIAEKIQGIIDANRAKLQAQKNIAQTQQVRAILFEDLDPESPTYGAMCMGTMGFQIASERTADGADWDWQTFGTGKGFTAALMVAGTMLADRIYGGTLTGVLIKNANGTFLVQTDETGDEAVVIKDAETLDTVMTIGDRGIYMPETGKKNSAGIAIHAEIRSDREVSAINANTGKTTHKGIKSNYYDYNGFRWTYTETVGSAYTETGTAYTYCTRTVVSIQPGQTVELTMEDLCPRAWFTSNSKAVMIPIQTSDTTEGEAIGFEIDHYDTDEIHIRNTHTSGSGSNLPIEVTIFTLI